MTTRNYGLLWVPIVLLLGPGGAARIHAQARSPVPGANRCVTVSTPGRLLAGNSFSRQIGHKLEVRVAWDRVRSWSISVGPVGSQDDYLWVVSPPLQTAPHLQIGEGYDLTAVQSARMSPRNFRFVITPAQYQDAVRFDDQAQRDVTGRITVADIERKGKGSLRVWITGFGTSESGDALTWITVKTRACQPG